MVRKFLGIRACDVCERDGPDTRARLFALGDRNIREADLCDRCWARLTKAMAPYVAVSRIPGRHVPGVGDITSTLPRSVSLTARMRQWARENGYEVSDGGHLPVRIVNAYYDEPGREEADREWVKSQPRRKKIGPACTICGQPSIARGWCWLHYQRWKRYGDPHAEVPKQVRPEPGGYA